MDNFFYLRRMSSFILSLNLIFYKERTNKKPDNIIQEKYQDLCLSQQPLVFSQLKSSNNSSNVSTSLINILDDNSSINFPVAQSYTLPNISIHDTPSEYSNNEQPAKQSDPLGQSRALLNPNQIDVYNMSPQIKKDINSNIVDRLQMYEISRIDKSSTTNSTHPNNNLFNNSSIIIASFLNEFDQCYMNIQITGLAEMPPLSGSVVYYDLPTRKTMSGAPIFFSNGDGSVSLIGIHSGKFTKKNCKFGTLITDQLKDWITNYCK